MAAMTRGPWEEFDEEGNPRPCTFYAYANKINRKVYFGITFNPERRHAAHSRDWQNPELSGKFINAIRKHGWENFEYIVICVCSCRSDARRAEMEAIASMGGVSRVYNSTVGGDGGAGCTPETREKMRQAKLGKKKPKDFGDKIRKALTGRKRGTPPDHVREAISQTLTGRKAPAEKSQARANKNFIKRLKLAADMAGPWSADQFVKYIDPGRVMTPSQARKREIARAAGKVLRWSDNDQGQD